MRQSRIIQRALRNVSKLPAARTFTFAVNTSLRGAAAPAVPSIGAFQNARAWMPTFRALSTLKTDYEGHAAERAAQGVVPKPLDAAATNQLVELLKNPPKGEEAFLLNLLVNCVPPGVDEAAYVKAAFLTAGKISYCIFCVITGH